MSDMEFRTLNARPGAGRPTRERAELRHQELLDRALELFLENGFELTTIEAIAASVGMTKRTVYARYSDKRALFKATVQRAIERWIVPIDVFRAVESDDLEATLTEFARIRLANAVSPAGLRLQRIINAESYRFPEIATMMHEQGTWQVIDYLADLLRRHQRSGALRQFKAGRAASAFLSMVVGGAARGVVLGGPVDEKGFEEHIHLCVGLFLDGARPR